MPDDDTALVFYRIDCTQLLANSDISRWLQLVPKDARPITQWPDPDVAYVDIVSAIRAAVGELMEVRGKPELPQARSAPHPDPLPPAGEGDEPLGDVSGKNRCFRQCSGLPARAMVISSPRDTRSISFKKCVFA